MTSVRLQQVKLPHLAFNRDKALHAFGMSYSVSVAHHRQPVAGERRRRNDSDGKSQRANTGFGQPFRDEHRQFSDRDCFLGHFQPCKNGISSTPFRILTGKEHQPISFGLISLIDSPSPDIYSTERGIPHTWWSTRRFADAVGELAKNLRGIPVRPSDLGSIVMSRKVSRQTLGELSRRSPIGGSRHRQNRKSVVRLYQAVVVAHRVPKVPLSRIAGHRN
jgi:hypothetical protein